MTWLNLVLGIISLAQWLTKTLSDNKTFAAGQTKAVADALQAAAAEVAKANTAGVEADKRHAKDKTDKAFNSEFQRKD
jgi:CHAT domain-containing protein